MKILITLKHNFGKKEYLFTNPISAAKKYAKIKEFVSNNSTNYYNGKSYDVVYLKASVSIKQVSNSYRVKTDNKKSKLYKNENFIKENKNINFLVKTLLSL